MKKAALSEIGTRSIDLTYLAFKVIFGAFFFFHGLGKLAPGFGGPGDISKFAAFGTFGLIWLAYLVAIGEMLVGLGVAFGVLSRIAALGGITIMLGVAITTHFPNGWNMISNGSEMSLLYLAAFLVIFSRGNGKYSIEKLITGKEAC